MTTNDKSQSNKQTRSTRRKRAQMNHHPAISHEPVAALERFSEETALVPVPEKAATRPVVPNPQTSQHSALRRMRVKRLKVFRRRRSDRISGGRTSRTALGMVICLATVFLVFSAGMSGAFAYYRAQLPLLDGIAQHTLFQTTHIYDRNGNLLYELYDHQTGRGRRTYVNYQDVSPLLVEATVAAEDRTFWTNSGVDYYGIVRAAVSDIQDREFAEGASTITQQLIKNQFFQNNPRNFQVKGEEAILATGLTQQYPKWKIMEMYLNTVYYGNLNYGVEAAAQDYFNLQPQCSSTGHCKPAVAQLDLAQASLLAGLPQSPSDYNPTIYKSQALARQQEVLQAMVSMGTITKDQATAAEQEMSKFPFQTSGANHQMQAQHFVNYVVDEVLVPLLGAQNLEDGGYNVYTTLDLNLEKKVEQIVYSHLYQAQNDSYLGYYAPLDKTNNVNNAAAVVMSPTTGEILAMDGSASTNPQLITPQMQGDFNATLAARQPGSSFKPIVYATAFEMGWYPAMILPDHQTYYPDGSAKPYVPQNYDGTFHTSFPMTARMALANSYNIPAIDTLEFAGIPNVVNMAGRLGLTEVTSRNPKDLGPAMAIGSIEVSPLHMTSAYATFANSGVRVPPVSVLSITNNQGRALYTFDAQHPQGVRVMRQDVAYLITSMLADKTARYHEFFPGNPLELDRPAAAKTGTTDSFRDNWTLGYTPDLTVGVWAGNSDNSIMNNVIGITGAGPIWHDIMEYTSQYYHFPAEDFTRPDDVHQESVSAVTGLLPQPGEATDSDWFIDGTLPTIHAYNYVAPQPLPQPIFCMGGACLTNPGATQANQNQNGQNSQNTTNITGNQQNQDTNVPPATPDSQNDTGN